MRNKENRKDGNEKYENDWMSLIAISNESELFSFFFHSSIYKAGGFSMQFHLWVSFEYIIFMILNFFVWKSSLPNRNISVFFLFITFQSDYVFSCTAGRRWMKKLEENMFRLLNTKKKRKYTYNDDISNSSNDDALY